MEVVAFSLMKWTMKPEPPEREVLSRGVSTGDAFNWRLVSKYGLGCSLVVRRVYLTLHLGWRMFVLNKDV